MKTRKPKITREDTARPRTQLSPISEQMRRWSALFETELLSWPGVIAKPMFGFRAIYRGKRIFAALPSSRGFGPDASILLKYNSMPASLSKPAETDSRIHINTPGKGWFSFALSSDTDFHDALLWLNHSYESTKQGKSR